MVFTPQDGKESMNFKMLSTRKVNVKPTKTLPEKRHPFRYSKPSATKKPKVIVLTSEVAGMKENTEAPPTGLAKLLRKALLKSKENNNPRSFKLYNKNSLENAIKPKRFEAKPKKGGTTITPITIEGTGAALDFEAPVLESSIYVPSEIVITASQSFPPISAVDTYRTNINNDISSEPETNAPTKNKKLSTNMKYPLGLVTTLGGTLISGQQTIVHETSVIGTYIDGRYAQVLKSTSKLYKKASNLQLETDLPFYETVRQVIKGTATQFFTPQITASLPLESLFSSASRKPRLEDEPPQEAQLTKRQGASLYERDVSNSQYQNEQTEEFDLQKSGTDQEPAISGRSSSPTPELPKYSKPIVSKFRQRFRPSGTRNRPPPFRRPNVDGERRHGLISKFRHPTVSQLKIPMNRKTQVKQKSNKVQQIKPTQVTRSEMYDSEETIRVEIKNPSGNPGKSYKVITLRSLHTFKLGKNINTRFVTYSRTITDYIAVEPTRYLTSKKQALIDNPPLFENILERPNNIATLPPIDLKSRNLNNILKTVTETYKTTETMYKTSVLPVRAHNEEFIHTLIQTFYITRQVSAIKTIPPVEAFEFIPADSFNEFNNKLLAEGTEHEAALLPSEHEHDENSGIRVKAPQSFQDANLAALVGGNFNPDALEEQLHPQLTAALKNIKQNGNSKIQLDGTRSPQQPPLNGPTPALSQEQLQLAYLRLYNPYMFGGLPQIGGPQAIVNSSPVVITTDITTTSTRVLKVIFNARPISTTITSISVVRTTITRFSTCTVPAAGAGGPGAGGFQFHGPMPFPAG